MDALARSLHLGNRHVSEFTAHLHIVDLYNVPLAEGECKVKWRFKGSIHLNNATNAVVIRDAFEGSRAYLWGNRDKLASRNNLDSDDNDDASPSAAANTTPAKLIAAQARRGSWTSPVNGSGAAAPGSSEKHSGHLSSLKDAILHPKRGRGRMSSSAQSSREGTASPEHSPAPQAGSSVSALLAPLHLHTNETSDQHQYKNRQDDGSEYEATTPAGIVNSKSPRPFLSPSFTRASGDYPFTSLDATALGGLRNTVDDDMSRSPSRGQGISRTTTRRGENTLSEGSPQSLPYGRNNSNERMHRASTEQSGLTREQRRDTERSEKLPDLPGKTESKGSTSMMPLNGAHACHFDQHIICAVQIPINKASGALQPSPVRLTVRHKVRTSPLHNAGTHLGMRAPHEKDGQASSSSASSVHGNIKEQHEEMHLGEVNLDLSEFVSSGLSMRAKDRWISRRYLLQNGKTNALLRIAIRMDWIGGERTFRAPPLRTGQIAQKDKRHSHSAGTDSSQYSHSGNTGNLMQHSNTSARSFVTVDNDGRNSSIPVSSSGSSVQSGYKGRARRKGRDDSPGQGTYDTTQTYDPTNAAQSYADQESVDLIESLFEDDAPYGRTSVWMGKRKGDEDGAGHAAMMDHNPSATGSASGAKAARDANPHHDLNNPAHAGYHASAYHPHRHNNRDTDQPILIRIPTAAPTILHKANEEHNQARERKASSSSKNSPTKAKKLPFISSRASLSTTSLGLDDGASFGPTRSGSTANLLKRPFMSSRATSSSAVAKAGGIGMSQSQSSASQQSQHSGDYFRVPQSRGLLGSDGPGHDALRLSPEPSRSKELDGTSEYGSHSTRTSIDSQSVSQGDMSHTSTHSDWDKSLDSQQQSAGGGSIVSVASERDPPRDTTKRSVLDTVGRAQAYPQAEVDDTPTTSPPREQARLNVIPPTPSSPTASRIAHTPDRASILTNSPERSVSSQASSPARSRSVRWEDTESPFDSTKGNEKLKYMLEGQHRGDALHDTSSYRSLPSSSREHSPERPMLRLDTQSTRQAQEADRIDALKAKGLLPSFTIDNTSLLDPRS